MRSMCSSTTRGWRVACTVCDRMTKVEGVVGIVLKVGVGVALHHRKPFGDAFVDALARQLDAAAVDAAGFEKPKELAVAAADVEHARAMLHHIGDDQQVDARAAGAARRLRHGEIVFQTRQHRYLAAAGRPRGLRGAFQEAAHDGEQFRLVEQESVVALVGRDFGKRDAGAGGIERMHDGARFRQSGTASRW